MKGGNGDTYGGDFWSYDWLYNSHTGGIVVSGGNGGTLYGGDAGYIEIISEQHVNVAGALVGLGGNSISDDGGDIDVLGGDFGSTFGFSAATSNAGSGFTAGSVGTIWLFGINIQ